MTHSVNVKDYQAVIPEETHTLVEFQKNHLPGVATINASLRDFEPKQWFPWHLSVMVEALELGEFNMPTPFEQQTLYDFEDEIEPFIKAGDNALFLARVTNNGWRELVYRIRDPKPVNDYLQALIRDNKAIRPFEYRMGADSDWAQAAWFIQELGS